MKYETDFKEFLRLIEKTLMKLLPPANRYPAVIHEAMHYSVFPGGKRFRPVLCLAACETVGGKAADALLPAASLELIHCYSLVHDDLPSMDNDDERRGKPTCHRKFGEPAALLAGDALLTLAFQALSQAEPPVRAARLLAEISTSAGSYGMIGGQMAELIEGPGLLSLPKLDFISSHKTGKLIKACAVSGGIAGGASTPVIKRMNQYGEAIGLAFQFIDDLVDGNGYMRQMNSDEARTRVRDLIAYAKRAIHPFGKKAAKLHALADFLLERMPQDTHAAVDR